jgi:hypothetical protein
MRDDAETGARLCNADSNGNAAEAVASEIALAGGDAFALRIGADGAA